MSVAAMDHCYPAEDYAAGLLERRWFAAGRAASEVQAECDALAHALDRAQAAWRGARTRLAHLEALRDALGEELVAGAATPAAPIVLPLGPKVHVTSPPGQEVAGNRQMCPARAAPPAHIEESTGPSLP